MAVAVQVRLVFCVTLGFAAWRWSGKGNAKGQWWTCSTWGLFKQADVIKDKKSTGAIGGFLIRPKLELLACEMMHNISVLPVASPLMAATHRILEQSRRLARLYYTVTLALVCFWSTWDWQILRTPETRTLLVGFLASHVRWQQGEQLPNNARRLKRKWSCSHRTCQLVGTYSTARRLSPPHLYYSLILLIFVGLTDRHIIMLASSEHTSWKEVCRCSTCSQQYQGISLLWGVISIQGQFPYMHQCTQACSSQSMGEKCQCMALVCQLLQDNQPHALADLAMWAGSWVQELAEYSDEQTPCTLKREKSI